MKKQTKLVAVLSTASMLAIGASMTSFAATGWVEENGTWVYYDRDGQRVTDQWARSGNGWYYLDENGEMATDQLIEDDGKYYYVDTNGVMVTNQWVAIENEDAGEDDEPDHHWYYFQANGRAMTNGNNDKVALKTINGKKYAFDDEGRMLWGWVKEDEAEHLDNTDGDAFMDGDYYFGGPDDGAMTVGWLQTDITYDGAEDEHYIAPVFSEDEDQTRWFYFLSNGKKIKADNGDKQKEKTLNGRRYAFDEYGAMTAEWSLDVEDKYLSATGSYTDGYDVGDYTLPSTWSQASKSEAQNEKRGQIAKYSHQWRYFSDVEDGARISRGWFKVVPAEYLDQNVYDDDEENWYYADGSGKLYAGEFKTINGKKFAFQNDGRCIFGLKFIRKTDDYLDVKSDDDADHPFDEGDSFEENASWYDANDYKAYYFGPTGDAPTDGAMRTGRQTVSIGGEDYTFYFETSGSKKGEGVTGEQDDRYYQSGKLLAAGSDEKYQVVVRTPNGDGYKYELVDDVEDLKAKLSNPDYNTRVIAKDDENYTDVTYSIIDLSDEVAELEEGADLDKRYGLDINKDAEDVSELYVFKTVKKDTVDDVPEEEEKWTTISALDEKDFFLVNASGRVVDSKGKSRDGSDYYFVTGKQGQIVAIYLED